MKEIIEQSGDQATIGLDEAKEAPESEGCIKCEFCGKPAEAHFCDAESFAIQRRVSLCGACADSSLPDLGSDARPKRTSKVGDIGVELRRIGIIEGTDLALLLFYEIGGDRRLPMAVEERDATLLVDALACRKGTHPTVHEAWLDAFSAVHAEVVETSICDFRDEVFEAKLHVAAGKLEAQIDIRPIDGLVLAIRAKAPIYISENVLQVAGMPRSEGAASSEASPDAPPAKRRYEIDYAGRDREAVGVVMKYLSGLKPPGLRQAQIDSLTLFFERQKELYEPERLTLDLKTQMVHLQEETERRVIFSQIVADDIIRKAFKVYCNLLPPTLEIHQLPAERVGALATLDLSAFAGCAESAADDFIALSMGLLRLSHWGLLVARAKEMAMLRGNPESEIEKYPLSWWQGGLAAFAMDMFGWPFDAKRGLLISAWAEFGGGNEAVHGNLKVILESFVCFHEIGHFEQHHGETYRQLKLTGGLRPEDHYKMEYEADKFALDHLLLIVENRSAIGAALAMLFALFACEPTLLERYPACDEAETHPHPLTRLIWLLRQLFPGDFREQGGYLQFAAIVVTDVIRELGGVGFTQSGVGDKDLASLIRVCLVGKPEATELQFGKQCNEVLDTKFREIEAVKRASRQSRAKS